MQHRTVRVFEGKGRAPLAVHIAAPIELARQAEQLGIRLADFDGTIRITSQWFSSCIEGHVVSEPRPRSHRSELLEMRMEDVEIADLVLVLAHDGTPRATLGDVAYALAQGKPVIWLCGRGGEGRSFWDAHAMVTLVPIGDIVRGFLDIWAAIKKADPAYADGLQHQAARS